MASFEQTSSQIKRKFTNDTDQNGEHIYTFDVEHDPLTKSFCSRPPPKPYSLGGNYQQTTKIIQEFNIQQSTNTSDITVSSTINIKSTPKTTLKTSNGDLLSEADFQRVVQDITPADRDLFDEFLNGIKQKTDDYLFLSTLEDLTSNDTSITSSERQSSSAYASTPANDYRRTPRTSLPRGSNTIHYGPQNVRTTQTAPAAQTLKQMAVQHQQRIIYNQQQNNTYTNYVSSSSSENFPVQYFPQPQTMVPDNSSSIESSSHYATMSYPSAQPTNFSSYQSANIYSMNNYAYQTTSTSYFPSSSTPVTPPISYPSTNLPVTNNSSHDDYLSLLDL